MSVSRVIYRILGFTLILCLGTGPSALALRPSIENRTPQEIIAAGMEENAESGSQFRPLDLGEFVRRTRVPGEDLEAYYRRYFHPWHRRVVEGQDKRALFLVLWRELNAQKGPGQQPIRHLPFLEDVIYETARALRVNAAEILIPTWAERVGLARRYSDQEQIQPEDISLRRLVSSYTAEDVEIEGFERDPKKAFTRALLVLGILTRVWDLHQGNVAEIPGTEIPLFFDFEEGLNRYYDDMGFYTRAFLLNYFHPVFHRGPARLKDLLDRLDWKEWEAGLRDAEKMDFEALRKEVKQRISSVSYHGEMPKVISDRIDGYFKLLIAHQRTLRADAKAFWKHAAAELRRTGSRKAPEGPDLHATLETLRSEPGPDQIMARIVALAEAQIRLDAKPDAGLPGKQVVIVDAALLNLPEIVLLLRALEQSEFFKGKTVVWGEDLLPEPGKVLLPKGLLHAKTQEELEELLLRLQGEGLQGMTYIGWNGYDVEQAVDAIIRQTKREIPFTRSRELSIVAVLAGLGVSQDLLQRFATDPEFDSLLSVQM